MPQKSNVDVRETHTSNDIYIYMKACSNLYDNPMLYKEKKTEANIWQVAVFVFFNSRLPKK